jgi:glycosyltransferase 2 family protein
MRRHQKHFIVLAKFLAFGALAFILVRLIKKNYTDLILYNFEIDIWMLVQSSLLLALSISLLPLMWFLITHYNNGKIKFTDTIVKRIISDIGKYLPGRIIGYGYLYRIYKVGGVKGEIFSVSVFYELLLSTLSAFTFFSITMVFTEYPTLDQYKWIFLLVSGVIVIGIHPYFLKMINKILRKITRLDITNINISYFNIMLIFIGYNLIWALYGLSFFAFTQAIYPGVENYQFYAGIYTLSVFIGFLTFFLPAGFGSREVAIILLLSTTLGNAGAVVISLSSRLWIIAVELIIFIIALILDYFYPRSISGKISSDKIEL